MFIKGKIMDKRSNILNKLIYPFWADSIRLYENGISIFEDIDKVCKFGFGHPKGPFQMMDEIGLDTVYQGLRSLFDDTGDKRFKVPEVLRKMVEEGILGKKTGKGFYTYKKGKKIKLKKFSANNASADLIDRMVVRMLNETVACLREGIVEDQDLLDAGCILGFGFAPFRGGPLTYAHERGFERLLETLKDFRARYGERFSQDVGWQEVA